MNERRLAEPPGRDEKDLLRGREIRDVGDVSEIAARSTASDSREDGVEDAVRAWVELRDRNVAAATSLPSDGLLTVTWSDLALFARDPEQFKAWLESGRALADYEDPVRSDVVVADIPSASSVPKGVDPADFGTFVHEVLQRLAVDGDLDAAIEATLPRYDFAKQRADGYQIHRAGLRSGSFSEGFAGSTISDVWPLGRIARC